MVVEEEYKIYLYTELSRATLKRQLLRDRFMHAFSARGPGFARVWMSLTPGLIIPAGAEVFDGHLLKRLGFTVIEDPGADDFIYVGPECLQLSLCIPKDVEQTALDFDKVQITATALRRAGATYDGDRVLRLLVRSLYEVLFAGGFEFEPVRESGCFSFLNERRVKDKSPAYISDKAA